MLPWSATERFHLGNLGYIKARRPVLEVWPSTKPVWGMSAEMLEGSY